MKKDSVLQYSLPDESFLVQQLEDRFRTLLRRQNDEQERIIRDALVSAGGSSPETECPVSAHKLNADRTVAVATDVFFNEDISTCPRGPKVQLLGAGGVATYGIYNGRDEFWIGWAPVPRRRPHEY